mmetsp:Transcript_5150/g.17296  ORF Transcript_5150/g.17296 Transcript_5150/m.17296 type:complete len:238 (+) Transcript_5150:248-961(+)
MGMAMPLAGSPSAIWMFWISVASLFSWASVLTVSTRTSCSSMDLMGASLSSTTISPVKGRLMGHTLLCSLPEILKRGSLSELARCAPSLLRACVNSNDSTLDAGACVGLGTSTMNSISFLSAFLKEPRSHSTLRRKNTFTYTPWYVSMRGCPELPESTNSKGISVLPSGTRPAGAISTSSCSSVTVRVELAMASRSPNPLEVCCRKTPPSARSTMPEWDQPVLALIVTVPSTLSLGR